MDEAQQYFMRLLEGNYPFAKSNRGNEFAPYNDFDERFLKKMSSEEKTNLFVSMLNSMKGDDSLNRILIWLIGSFEPRFRGQVNALIENGEISNRTKTLIQFGNEL